MTEVSGSVMVHSKAVTAETVMNGLWSELEEEATGGEALRDCQQWETSREPCQWKPRELERWRRGYR